MNIGIVGAGILGQLLALEMVHAGDQVSIFDRNSLNNCSAAAAGLLTPATELEKNPILIYQLGMDALNEHWPDILSKLSRQVYFRRQGSMVFAHPQDRVDLLRYFQIISSKLPSVKHVGKMDNRNIVELESELSKFDEGYYFPDDGQIDNHQLLDILKSDLHDKEMKWHDNVFVDGIDNNEVKAGNKRYQFDMVFDCRGLGAKTIYDNLRSVRGELIWLHAPDVNISRPIRFLHPRYSLYIVPRPGNIYLVGASEIESEDPGDISVRTSLELLTSAYYIHPGFCDAKIIKTVTQCRPTLSDHLPKIKFSNQSVAINGLYRHGYLIAPTLIEEIKRWMRGGIAALRYPEIWEKTHD